MGKITDEALRKIQQILEAQGLAEELEDLLKLASRDVVAYQCESDERYRIGLIKNFLAYELRQSRIVDKIP